jgi:hypothetical protein
MSKNEKSLDMPKNFSAKKRFFTDKDDFSKRTFCDQYRNAKKNARILPAFR